MSSNVLVLSAGRRVELVKSFQEELTKLLPEGKVFCTDMNPVSSAACQSADGFFKVPRCTDVDYLNTIYDICKSNDIGLVIPTIDTELELLADVRERFLENKINIVISEPSLVAYCRDKRKTAVLFSMLEVDQPLIYQPNGLVFPLFCKPYDGSCSVGAFPILNENELTKEVHSNPKNMFMELIPSSYSEYTVDCYYSTEGALKALVPRKRLEVRAGEVSKGITKKNFVYDYLMEKVSNLDGARGCITIQLFVEETEQKIKGLEINPRFGGGFPLAYEAGANFPKWLLEEYLLSKTPDFYDNWEPNLMMLRYDAKVLVRDN
ncbi:ATP-grasp domain-containing protein [Vibrio breoganii]